MRWHAFCHMEGLDYDHFVADRRTLEAVERNFILIGEAARSVPVEIENRFPNIPWADMRAMRNFVVDVYWGVDPRRLWDTVHTNLPPLVPLLEAMLRELDDDVE